MLNGEFNCIRYKPEYKLKQSCDSLLIAALLGVK